MRARRVTRRGRPLAFLASLCIAWIGLRIALLAVWPEAEAPALAKDEPAVHIARDIAGQVQAPALVGERADPQVPEAEPAVESPPALEAPPPAHLGNGLDPLPAAAAHNVLWMDASGGFEAASPPPVAALSEPRPDENF